LTEFEKEIEVIKKDKTSTYLIKDEADISEENIYLYLLDSSQSTQSTCDNSKTSTNYESYSNLSIDSNDNINENIFNYARANFCLRYRLYDFSLKEENIEFIYPPKYKINDEFSAYVYPNEITTFAFSISGFLLNDNMNIVAKLISIKIISITPSATPAVYIFISLLFPVVPKNELTIPTYNKKFVVAAIKSLFTKENIHPPIPTIREPAIPEPFKKVKIL